MAFRSMREREQLFRMATRQHARRLKLPRSLYNAIHALTPDAQTIAAEVARANVRGVEMPAVVVGAYRGLVAARGETAIEEALAHLAKVACWMDDAEVADEAAPVAEARGG